MTKSVTGKVTSDLAAEAEAEAYTSTAAKAAGGKPSVPPRAVCPYQKIIELFHETLPTLPRCLDISEERKAKIRARWQNGLGSLEAVG